MVARRDDSAVSGATRFIQRANDAVIREPVVKPVTRPAVVSPVKETKPIEVTPAPATTLQDEVIRVAQTKIDTFEPAQVTAPATQTVISKAPETIQAPAAETTNQTTNKMAWKPKTIAGKILKGAVIGGGTILGIASGVGAIGGIVGGAGAIAGAASGVKSLGKVAQAAGKLVTGGAKGAVNTLGKVATGAVNLITGTTQEERQQVRQVKAETKEAQDKLDQVKRLVRAGSTEEKALALVGLSPAQVPEVDGVKIPQNNNIFMYAGLGLAALFILPKILKR